MNTTIDLKTAKTIEAMNQKINHMDNAVTDFFNKMSDVLERQLGDDEVYAAVIAPEIELTITPLANVRSYLPCFDETDSCYSISEDVPLALCYDPRQVITLAGKRYLSGAVIFVRYDTDGNFVALTTSDLYLIQCYLGENSVPLMAGREKIGQIPQLEKLVATIRSREISACLVLQTRSQLKAIYKDNADTIVGNMDSQIFLGGSEPTTLKDLAEALGKETIDSYNNSDTRGNSPSYGTNYQKLGHELMSRDELAVLDGGKCILQLRGVRPFLSDKYDLTQHPNYKYTSDYDPKNALDIKKFLKRKEKIHPDDTFIMVDADSLPPA